MSTRSRRRLRQLLEDLQSDFHWPPWPSWPTVATLTKKMRIEQETGKEPMLVIEFTGEGILTLDKMNLGALDAYIVELQKLRVQMTKLAEEKKDGQQQNKNST